MAKQRPRVEIVKTGKKITLKRFKRESTHMLAKNSVTKKEIIDSKILSKKEFEEFIEKYKIPVTTKSHIEYIDRELFLKSLKEYKNG